MSNDYTTESESQWTGSENVPTDEQLRTALETGEPVRPDTADDEDDEDDEQTETGGNSRFKGKTGTEILREAREQDDEMVEAVIDEMEEGR